MQEFTDLSPREVLALAIAIEERNCNRYKEWSARFKPYDHAASGILDDLAREEEQHKRYLARRYFEIFGERVIRIDPTLVKADIELPDLPDEHFFVVDKPMAKTLLAAALQSELNAMNFYQSVLDATTNPDHRMIYEPLAQFEADHVRLLTERLDAL